MSTSDPSSPSSPPAGPVTLVALDDLELLGHGPEATGTGPGGGWWMRRELWFRCDACGGFVSGDPTVTEECGCGALYKDSDAGRIGSRNGDAAIAVYRRRTP